MFVFLSKLNTDSNYRARLTLSKQSKYASLKYSLTRPHASPSWVACFGTFTHTTHCTHMTLSKIGEFLGIAKHF